MSEENETPALCELCGRPASYTCDICGAPVCEQHAASVDIDYSGNIQGITCVTCYDASDYLDDERRLPE
jgi:hypothetical protein